MMTLHGEPMRGATSPPLRIVALGGAIRSGSSTEKALRIALSHMAAHGAVVQAFAGDALNLPLFSPERTDRSEGTRELVEAMAAADGIVLGSPGYHGGVSGLVKNALDYAQDLASGPRPFFAGRAVGCVATGTDWLGLGGTLAALRSIVHSLDGWPTPMGVVINTSAPVFAPDGSCLNAEVDASLRTMALQVIEFGLMRRGTVR
jgi:FMN reductase